MLNEHTRLFANKSAEVYNNKCVSLLANNTYDSSVDGADRSSDDDCNV